MNEEEEEKMQASVFGDLGLKVAGSRTVDYYRGDLDQKHFKTFTVAVPIILVMLFYVYK